MSRPGSTPPGTQPLFDFPPPEDPRVTILRKGIRFHLYARSAEGRRSGMDRKLAAERTARASARVRAEATG